MKLALQKLHKIVILCSLFYVTINTKFEQSGLQSIECSNQQINEKKLNIDATKSSKWSTFTHGLSALAIITCAKYGIDFLQQNSNFITPIESLQHPPTLQLNDSSWRTYFVNHWISDLVDQYNKTKSNTVDCINSNITSINTTITNLNSNIKTAGLIGIAAITTTALYGIYNHYKKVTVYQPIKNILFEIYTLLTNNRADNVNLENIHQLALQLISYVQKLPTNNAAALQKDATILANHHEPTSKKIAIIKRILKQYSFLQ